MKYFLRHFGLLTGVIVMMTLFAVGCSTKPIEEVTLNQNINNNEVGQTNTNFTSNSNTSAVTDGQGDANLDNWLTYTNEEYKFSLRYPQEWGGITIKNQSEETDDSIQGTRIFFRFEPDIRYIEDGYDVPDITITSQDFEFQGVTDGGDFDFKNIDFSLSDEQLSEVMKRPRTTELIVEKTNIDGKPALRLDEVSNGLDGEEDFFIDYLVPQFDQDKKWNMSFFAAKNLSNSLDQIVETIEFSFL